MKGKAPSRYFIHDGTQYVLTGNKRLAMSHFHELRSHLKLLKMINIQNLPIISGAKEFNDGTTARFQLIHGKETISVYAPSYISGGEDIETKTISEDYERIVPIFRSSDDAYWVACLGGGFNPPYYAFENVNGITAEQLEDNNEYDLDKTLISEGNSPLSETVGIPSLYFVSQSAKHVPHKYYTNSAENSPKSFDTLFETYYHSGLPINGQFYCPNETEQNHNYPKVVTLGTFDYNETNISYWTDMDDIEFFLPQDEKSMQRTVSGDVVAICTNSLTANGVTNENTVGPESSGASVNSLYDEFGLSLERIILEEDDKSKGTACTYHLTRTGSSAYSDPYTDCNSYARYDLYIERVIQWGTGPTNIKKEYYLYVDGEAYSFFTPFYQTRVADNYHGPGTGMAALRDQDEDVYCDESMLKYYDLGEESDGSEVLFCARVDVIRQYVDEGGTWDLPSGYNKFMYIYFITGNDLDIIEFIPGDYLTPEHIIPNVDGIDDTVVFEGKVFMGKITATGKEVTTIEV